MATVEELMIKLKCTKAEAEDIVQADARIDKGEKLFEQTADQQQASKKARAVGRAVGVYKFSQRERKADTSKKELIARFVNLLQSFRDVGNVEITNPEREILFSFNGKKYRIILAAPRK